VPRVPTPQCKLTSNVELECNSAFQLCHFAMVRKTMIIEQPCHPLARILQKDWELAHKGYASNNILHLVLILPL
jgi:hypothetical protein